MSVKKIIVLSAPSGTGKTSIIQYLTSPIANLPLSFSISATTRKKREGEIHGSDYYFLSLSNFQKDISNNAFVEYEEVYENTFYGTYHSELKRIWEGNKVPLFDIDVKGASNIKKQYPKETLLIFINPPSLEELENRLLKRNTNLKSDIEERLNRAKLELSYAKEFDRVVVNEELEITCKATRKIIAEFIEA